jgi:hypothetical protein
MKAKNQARKGAIEPGREGASGGRRRRRREEEGGRGGGKRRRREALQEIVRLALPARPGRVLIGRRTIPAQPRPSQQDGRGRRVAQ